MRYWSKDGGGLGAEGPLVLLRAVESVELICMRLMRLPITERAWTRGRGGMASGCRGAGEGCDCCHEVAACPCKTGGGPCGV